MTSVTPTDVSNSPVVKKPDSRLFSRGSYWGLNLGVNKAAQKNLRKVWRHLGHQASLERWNRLLLGAVAIGFLVTIATYGWVVHQKFAMQQLIQETQALQESNTARSIHLNRLQSFTGIMKNAQDSHWLSAPKETLTLMAPVGQPLPNVSSPELSSSDASRSHTQRWPIVTGY